MPCPFSVPFQSSPRLVGDSTSTSTEPVASFVAVRTHAVVAILRLARSQRADFRMTFLLQDFHVTEPTHSHRAAEDSGRLRASRSHGNINACKTCSSA